MPVTKTAKRALRGSKRKTQVNKVLLSKLEIAIRVAQKSKKTSDISKAESLVDRAKKKNVFHRNKASRLKSTLSKIVAKRESGKTDKPSSKQKKTLKK